MYDATWTDYIHQPQFLGLVSKLCKRSRPMPADPWVVNTKILQDPCRMDFECRGEKSLRMSKRAKVLTIIGLHSPGHCGALLCKLELLETKSLKHTLSERRALHQPSQMQIFLG